MFLKSRNIHRKTPMLESLFNDVAGQGRRLATLLKRDLLSTGILLPNFSEQFILVEHLWWALHR